MLIRIIGLDIGAKVYFQLTSYFQHLN